MTASWAFQPSCIPSTSRGTVKEQFPDLFESLHSLEECVIKIIIKGKYKVFKITKPQTQWWTYPVLQSWNVCFGTAQIIVSTSAHGLLGWFCLIFHLEQLNWKLISCFGKGINSHGANHFENYNVIVWKSCALTFSFLSAGSKTMCRLITPGTSCQKRSLSS